MNTAPSFSVSAVRTEIFNVGDDLARFIVQSLGQSGLTLREGTVLAVTSKIVSLAERRLVGKSEISKRELIVRESDTYLGEIGFGSHLSIKHGLLIASAGIDESNSKSGDYILYPLDPFASARRLHAQLVEYYQLKKLGVLLTDSHTQPLRRGVTGLSLAHCGFRGVKSLVGHQDLFGRPLQMTQLNLVDGLASAAVMVMGEADERCPLAMIQGAAVEFNDPSMNDADEVSVALKDDLYAPIFLGRQNNDS